MSEWDDLYDEWGRDFDGVPLPLTVETHQGAGSKGPNYAAPVDRPGLPQFAQQRLVRNSEGHELTSTAAIYAPLSEASTFVPHSRVTLAGGRVSTVEMIDTSDIAGLFGFIRVDVA